MSTTERASRPNDPARPDDAASGRLASRRTFLGRAAGALAGASVAGLGTAAAVPAASSPVTPEDPALVALGEKVGPALDAFRAAKAAKAEARARAEALCPAVPADLVHQDGRQPFVLNLHACVREEVDVEGQPVRPPGWRDASGRWEQPRGRSIYAAGYIEEAIEEGWLAASPRSRQGRHVRHLLALAEQHESARAAAIEMSGLPAAKEALRAAERDLEALAQNVRDTEAATPAGVLIIARVAAAFGEATHPATAGVVLGPALVGAVLRVIDAKGGGAADA
ncbi:hypothetical protein CCR97_19020 [Rhodoplanes elegans]|uniref:Uncharacterized protein n=1 Tax=Rhodoplanes elegans TaxID=29408 RepID=A0A327KTI5_9BRAD|nr:hypothetical protein [Rhodoplanes elegans]MBK5960277.1 hypothetical protein [Rhodoplanes elegans]RAI40725.1 hypothetical protein CH338_05405 [Rhodoplanes elegans]